jgi:DNA-binding response OmpR family regulator
VDGMTSTRAIRQYEDTNRLPRCRIVALTGLASASARLEAISSGVDHFMTKPMNFKALEALLKRGNERRRKHSESQMALRSAKEEETTEGIQVEQATHHKSTPHDEVNTEKTTSSVEQSANHQSVPQQETNTEKVTEGVEVEQATHDKNVSQQKANTEKTTKGVEVGRSTSHESLLQQEVNTTEQHNAVAELRVQEDAQKEGL